MTHISIDLETLGTQPGSVILSIGAVKFDPITGEIGEKFYANITPKSCLDVGLVTDQSTVEWWSTQSQEARDALKVDRQPLQIVLHEFSQYASGADGVWGWGATFDVSLTEAAYRAVKLDLPWKFWNVKCGRTVCGLVNVSPVRNTGTHHKADVDAEMQAIAICQAYKKLKLA
jgi:hypothetical protein